MLNIKYTPEESPSPNRLSSSREENLGLDKSSSESNKRLSRNISKRDALEKYQEHDDSSSYMNDFDIEGSEDLNLSYSKFSRVSGVSFISGNDSNRLSSISGSPFVKNIQTRLQDIKFEEERKLNSRDAVRTSRSNRPKSSHARDKLMYLIDEGALKNANDENESPFLDHAPILKTPVEKIGSTFEENFDLKPMKYDHLQNPKARGSYEQAGHLLEKGSKNLVRSTPDKRKQQRMSSVKVSLTPAQRFEKRPGTRLTNALENFQFSTLVGRGASANVYKGINLKTNQVVAIKQIILEKDQNVMELMGEIDLLKILKHPNIVKYHGFVKTSTSLNVFLEFCSKGSLRQLYQHTNHGLPEGQIIGFVGQILQGLNYLHEQGVVHRDVKAANVLITEDEFIKLADFGVATKVSSQHETVVGTPNWMAPETVLGGEGLCTASDIWSLGATIIELFTTNPPYHDLNPMATLHAIGTDDHPPLPKNISPLAKDFLLECFQKQPNLRISAKSLLKHKWLTKSTKGKHMAEASSSAPNSDSHTLNPISIHNYSESNEENWENDFLDMNLPKIKASSADPAQDQSNRNGSQMKVSKSELLNKFLDKNEDFDFEQEAPTIISKFDKNDDLHVNLESNNLDESPREEEEEDPFLEIDIEDFNTNELEVQSKMEFLTTKFSNRVDLCHSGNDEVTSSLIKITGRMLHLVKKYRILHDVLIRDHGILSLLELLENAPELPKHQKLWFHALSILNNIFEQNIPQFENFCLLGGIPVVTHFRSSSYDQQVRLQVVKFIKFLNLSDKALSMFVSSGGLRVLSKFVEEDFDATPEFPLTSIDCIYSILSKDLTRSKSNLCRILSKYGVIFWFVVLLNRLTKSHSKSAPDGISQDQILSTINKIIEIIKYFGQSETRVRVNISNSDLFKLLIKVYPNLQYQHQLVILKFFKSISQISDILKALYSADILEFLVRIMEFYTPSREHYKEVINVICPTIYNCCYLNHAREVDLVKLGAVPHLKALSKINLPFRQFVLPILCELVHCDDYVRQVLLKHDILAVYFNLLIDPYWQSNALDSILSWSQHTPDLVKLDTPKAISCFVGGFMLPKVSSLEATLDSYLKLITVDRAVCYSMAKESIINNILLKLTVHNKNPVVQLNLLRILKSLVSIMKRTIMLINLDISQNLLDTLNRLKSRKTSVLVDELAIEIVSLVM